MFFPLTEWELMDDEDEISEEEQVVGDAWKRRGSKCGADHRGED